jgi:hypothetical protein
MCRYKDMAKKSSDKFNDEVRKKSLMRSLEKRESKVVK